MSNSKTADPRVNNVWFNASSMDTYFSDYKKNLNQALETVKSSELEKAFQVMKKVTQANGTFFICGNGGSNAIADHLSCDWTKGTYVAGKNPLRTQSLMANGPLFTAAANDFGYDRALAYLLEIQARPTDGLLVISSSGNSPNIIEAMNVAKAKGLPVIALTGFKGGKAKELADVSLHVDFQNYAIVEDGHQAIMQCLAQYFFVKYSE
jgi:D-sedoheptulose 7-phosphate isomerase